MSSEPRILDTLYVNDVDADEEEKSKINSGFSKFLGLLQNTSGFLRKLSLAATEGDKVELETKVIRRFAKISQSRRRPLLGPSSG